MGLLTLAISLEDPFDEVALDGISIYEASDQVMWVSKGFFILKPAVHCLNRVSVIA